MKTLLATSRTTFVPNNYDALVVGLATSPQIGGLLVLDNFDRRLLLQAAGLLAGGAPRIGWTLLGNAFGTSQRRRRAAYAAVGKPVFKLSTVNCPAAPTLLRDYGFDLVLNARTRDIYGDAMLAAPSLGCLNIHHGLLPEQRGLMCDLWALFEGAPAGFSVHVMSRTLDAGEILLRETVSTGAENDYLAYLLKASRRESVAIAALLAEIECRKRILGEANRAPPGLIMRRNPARAQIRAMRRRGLRL